MSDPFLAELVVQEDHELLFNCKTGGIRIKAQKANDFTPSELSQIQHALTVLLESRKVLIFPEKPKVNLHQVVTLGIPFLEYLHVRSKKPNALSPSLESEFGEHTARQEILQRLMQNLQEACLIPSLMWSDYEKGFCLIDARLVPHLSDGTKALAFYIKRQHPESLMFRLRNNSREAFRVATKLPGSAELHYPDLTPEMLGISHPLPQKGLPVYIQRHALSRIYERLDCIDPSILLPTIYSAIHHPSVIIINHKRVLLTVMLANAKVGYFLASVEKNALLIRTFLFITASGTPEGNSLRKTTKLQKLDIKHLALDKLSSFVTNRVVTNPQIRMIFEKVGYGYLFCSSLTKFVSAEFLAKHTPAEKLPAYIANNRL